MVNAALDFTGMNDAAAGDGLKAISVSVYTDVGASSAILDEVSKGAAFTGYQHPSFIKAWLRAGDAKPVFIVFQATGHGKVLLPLERNASGMASYIGGRHANGNFPIGKKTDLEALGSRAIEALERCEALPALGLHSVALERQHESWDGIANPFVGDQSVSSPNVALSFSLEGGFEAVLGRCSGSRKRKKFRNQMRKLETIGDVHIVIPVGLEDAAATLEQFFNFKADRFREAGITDVFADDATRAAFMDMFIASADMEKKTHELHILTVGGKTAAIMGCTIHEGRLTVEFSTFNPQLAYAGPGDLLFFLAVQDAAERGLSIFDFGVGDEQFKRSWCDIETWHKDTFVAVSAKGQLTRIAKQMRSEMVRRLKSNEQLWKTAKAARRKLSGLRG